jgi:hypothetical protein
VVAGASLGAVVGALASTGVIPAHDIAFFQTGPLVAALKSAAAGTFVGFVLGALSGLEDWKEEVEIDVDAFTERSGVLVSVPAKDERARRAREVMTEAGARSVEG